MISLELSRLKIGDAFRLVRDHSSPMTLLFLLPELSRLL